MGIKPDGSVTLSFSELTTYLDCPYKHKLSYLNGEVPKEEKPHLAYGTALHLGLQSMWNHTLEESKVIFHDEMTKVFERIDKTSFAVYCNKGDQLMDKFSLTYYLTLELVKAEFQLREPLIADVVFFTGFIDGLLLNKEDDHITIVDFKTTNTGWPSAKKRDHVTRMQLLLYKYFWVKKMGYDPDKVTCKFLLFRGDNCTLDEVVVSSTEEELNAAYAVLIDVLKHIYKKKLNNYKNIKACRFCRWDNPKDCDKISCREDYVNLNAISKPLQIVINL